MENSSSNIWAPFKNSVFRRFWFATVISGSCVAAQNTATYWAINALGATTVLISVMATVSALPGALFTLPAGAIADMVDRKKILLAVQIWQASIIFGLAILWAAHLLNPYLILASTFLLSAGFAFSSPASSVAIAEMVSREELAPAYTLGGLQMDLSGIVGPLLGGVLLPLIGVSFIFGASGLHHTEERNEYLGYSLQFPFSVSYQTISGLDTFGDNSFATAITAFPVLRNQEKYQWRYDVSHSSGHHSPRFGVNFIHEPVLSGALSGTAENITAFAEQAAIVSSCAISIFART